MIDLTIIIVSYNTIDLLKKCINAIEKYEKKVKKIIIVDNNSSDGTLEYLSKFIKQKSRYQLVSLKKNKGFAAGNNVGLKKAKTKYSLLLNSDTEFKSSILEDMVSWMDENDSIGVSSCKLVYSSGKVQGTGGYFPNLLNVFTWMTIQDLPFVDNIIKPFHPHKEKSANKNDKFYESKRELDWVTGAFFLIRSKMLKEIGYIDEDYFMYTEEVDLCYRANQKSWKVMYNPKWEIIHHGGSSSTKEFSVLQEFKGVKRFFKKHKPSWQFPVLIIFLKLGSLLRVVAFGLTEGKNSSKIYLKAFNEI